MDSNHSSDVSSDSAPLILGHQRSVFEKLTAIGRTCFSAQRQTLPVRLRTNVLIIGPTGSGKTYLAEAVARELEAPFLPISLSNWIILGGTDRGAQTTWVAIANFLYENRKASGVVIFLDEIDKHRRPMSSWDQQIQVEAFLLLDGKTPRHLKDEEGDVLREEKLAVIQEVLANRVLVVAAGAFQDIWDCGFQTRIGFGNANGESPSPNSEQLSQTLPREIINRFSRYLQILQPLGRTDYEHMLQATVLRVPVYLRDTFIRIGRDTLDEAMRMGQGCRFVEDVMLQTLLAERANLQSAPSKHVENSKEVTTTESIEASV